MNSRVHDGFKNGVRQTLASGTPRKGRGQCKTSKTSLRKCLDNTEWVKDVNGRTQGVLKHFLKAVPVNSENTDKRAATLNKQLQAVGFAGRVVQQAVPGKAGKKPWLASRTTLRKVYDLV